MYVSHLIMALWYSIIPLVVLITTVNADVGQFHIAILAPLILTAVAAVHEMGEQHYKDMLGVLPPADFLLGELVCLAINIALVVLFFRTQWFWDLTLLVPTLHAGCRNIQRVFTREYRRT